MINGVHHVAISTPDLKRLEAFYTELGFKTLMGYEWPQGTEVADAITALKGSSATMVMMRLGNCHLEMFQYHTPEPKTAEAIPPLCDHGITHICLDVTDLDYEYKRMLDLGMKFHCEPQDVGPGVRTTYGRDPDGNTVELQEVLEKDHPIAL